MSETQVENAPVEATEEASAPEVRKPKAATPCACSLYKVLVSEGEVIETHCTATTVRSFVPGHDAKLKSMLIKAAIAGHEVERTNDDGTETFLTARQAAEDFNFASHIDKGVETHERREAEKAERKARADEKRAAAQAKRDAEKADRDAAREAKKAEAAAKREADKQEREAKAAAKKAEREAAAQAKAEEKARKQAEKDAAKRAAEAAGQDAADESADSDEG